MLSYAGKDLPPFKRKLVTLIEKAFGSHLTVDIFQRFFDDESAPEQFYRKAARALNLKIHAQPTNNVVVPKTGPLLVVANHPFGIIDGLAIAAIVESARNDLRIVVWDAIDMPLPEKRFLALDLCENSISALRQNVRIRNETIAHLHNGGSILLFPSGSAERSKYPWSAPVEQPWTSLAGKLAIKTSASVLPVFVYGHNSRLFHAASIFGDTVRRALFLRETCVRQNTTVKLHFLPSIYSPRIASLGSPAEIVCHLRECVVGFTTSKQSTADPVIDVSDLENTGQSILE